MAVVEDRRLVEHFLDVCVEVLVKCANAQLELGVDAVTIGEGGAGAHMLSPKMYEELLLPVHRRMVARVDGPTVMHICGDVTPRLPMLKETGITCFNFDWAIRPKAMVEASAGAFRVMGNVNTADLLNATPGEIERQVIECLEAGECTVDLGGKLGAAATGDAVVKRMEKV